MSSPVLVPYVHCVVQGGDLRSREGALLNNIYEIKMANSEWRCHLANSNIKLFHSFVYLDAPW